MLTKLKSVMLLLVLAALSFGALASVQSISESQLQEQDGLYYAQNTDKPFTGRVVVRFYDGRIRSETYYKDGKKDGTSTAWFSDGQVKEISNYKEGQRDGEWTMWNRARQVLFHHVYSNGAPVF